MSVSERFYQPGTGLWFESREAAEAAALASARAATAEEREKARDFADTLDWKCESCGCTASRRKAAGA